LILSYGVATYFDDIEKYKKLENVKSAKKIKKIKKSTSRSLVHANNVLRDFVESNVTNIEPMSAKLDESILERVEPNPPSLLRGHFYPP